MLFGLLLGLRPGDRRLWLVALAILAAQFSISALNDWADAAVDAAAGRLRPIPLALVSRREALTVALASGAVGVAASLEIGRGGAAILLFAIGLGCGWLYDLVAKSTPFSFLPFAVAFPLLGVWVGLAAGRSLPGLLPFFAVGVPLGIAIHLADSIPDLASDAASGSDGLAVMLGSRRTVVVIQGALVLSSLVVVKSFLHQLPVAITVGVVSLIGAGLAKEAAAEHPGRMRWLVTATALALVIPWLAVRR